MARTRTTLISALGALTLTLGACGGEESKRDAQLDPLGPASTSPRESGSTDDGASSPPAAGQPSGPPARGQVREVATGLEVPWDIAFPEGSDPLVSERDSGRIMRLTDDGKATEFMTVPGVEAAGEGGLLGLAASPDFATDKTIFAYFTASSDNRIVSIDTRTKKATPILTGLAKGQIHNGGALEFGPDGKLYAGVGETGDTGLAQDRSSNNGKILRIGADGDIPSDNPIEGSPIWSLGHRNVQGIAWDSSDRMWASEFGQNEVDEVNLIKKGGNYGWPEVEGEGNGADDDRFVAPVVSWTPTSSSSPSGAAITGDELYVGALAGRTLWRIRLNGRTVDGDPKGLFANEYGRIRGVATAPDGSIWFTTSNTDGRGEPKDGDDRVVQLGV